MEHHRCLIDIDPTNIQILFQIFVSFKIHQGLPIALHYADSKQNSIIYSKV